MKLSDILIFCLVKRNDDQFYWGHMLMSRMIVAEYMISKQFIKLCLQKQHKVTGFK